MFLVIDSLLWCLFGMFHVEAMEGIDLGETTHKKPGTTVPESIHSFSKFFKTFILLSSPSEWV